MNALLISSLLLLSSYGGEPESLALTPTVASLAGVTNAQNAISTRSACIELSTMLVVICMKQTREAEGFSIGGGIISTVRVEAKEVDIKLLHWPPKYMTLRFRFPPNK